MVVRKIRLTKKHGEDKIACYPESSANVIIYEDGLSVKEVLDAIVDSVEQVENRLQGRSIYMRNRNGEIITDEAGVGLVELL